MEEQESSLKELFTQIDSLQQEVETLTEELEALKSKKSDCVKAIFDRFGRGPFSHNGSVSTIRVRGNTYFFVSPAKKGIINVEDD